MKAIHVRAPGGPEQLFWEDAPDPKPADGEVLIRVHASGITPDELSWSANWRTRDGQPRHLPIPGHELAGVVEALGPGVADVNIGDAVYALTDFWRDGSDAELMVARAEVVAPKPASLLFVEAAAVPLSALSAWQALFVHGQITAGQKVLIHGAAGGVGTFAVQLAHWRGATVIGTAAEENVAFLLRLGCDEVIDYRKADFAKAVRDCDFVLDTVGGATLARSPEVLRRGGALVSLVEMPQAGGDVRGSFFIVEPSRDQLIEIGTLIDTGEIRPIVAAVLPIDCARAAFERGLRGGIRGKIVLRVD